MRHVLLHISDIHCGPPFQQRIAEDLLQQAHTLRPDLTIVSGDLVQRADFPDQWRSARRFLAALPQPYLVIPGNHDVPLFLTPLRALAPLALYRRMISPELNPVFTRPGLLVVGANTAHGWTIDGGYLGRRQRQRLEQIFAGADARAFKILVQHHHLAAPNGRRRNGTIGAAALASMLDRQGVDLLLSGHLHESYIGNTRDIWPALQRGTLICQIGTATSRRGYGCERGQNTYNIITIDDEQFHVVRHRATAGDGRFEPTVELSFRRAALEV